MNKYYITFGQEHRHKIEEKIFDKFCVGVIKAHNYQEARDIAFRNFSDRWCLVYTEACQPDMNFFPDGLVEVN